LTEYLIGTGGWAHFKIPKKTALRAYSEKFDFVEVNNTFYKYPGIRAVERWRRTVPRDFTFSVRCHHDLTHKIGLKPVDDAFQAFSAMIEICRALEAPILHLLTPRQYAFNREKRELARDFFSSIDQKEILLAWEVRSTVDTELAGLMEDFRIIHSVDISRKAPAYQSEILYSRIFGKAKHNIYQFTDEELVDIYQRIQEAEVKKAVVTFHGIRMSGDALRFKQFRESGEFMPITAFTGVASAEAVLQEDARFPTTREALISHQGWKVIDLAHDKRVHLSELLRRIPEKRYNSVKEVTEELEVFL
jgi:uncharacterized protein YecE (DUF72 family)